MRKTNLGRETILALEDLQTERPFTRQKNLGADPSKKRYGPITFAKKCWSFYRAIGAYGSCRNSSVSLQKLWVRTAFLMAPDPNFSVV